LAQERLLVEHPLLIPLALERPLAEPPRPPIPSEQAARIRSNSRPAFLSTTLLKTALSEGRFFYRGHTELTPPDLFLQEIIANPGADEPRLIYADWLEERGDPHGQFIRTQCTLAHLDPYDEFDARREPLQTIETDLLDRFGQRWASPVRRLVSGYRFHRGFVEQIELSWAQFRRNRKRLLASTPLRRVQLVQADPNGLSWLGGLKTWGGIEAFRFEQLLYKERHWRKFVESTLLEGITGLDLGSTSLTPELLEALLDSPYSTSLRALELAGVDWSEVPVMFFRTMRISQLRRLSIGSNLCSAAFMQRLCNSGSRLSKLQELQLAGSMLSDQSLRRLAESTLFTTLRRLVLSVNSISPGAMEQLVHAAVEREAPVQFCLPDYYREQAQRWPESLRQRLAGYQQPTQIVGGPNV